jgi:hypothetical protein
VRIDRAIEEAFAGRGSPLAVARIRPEGLSLRLTFRGTKGGSIDLKLYPHGEASSTCASTPFVDILYQAADDGLMDDEARRDLETIVDALVSLDLRPGLADWEETLGESADARFLCGRAVEIKLTRRCNQACIFCKSSSKLENYETAARIPRLLERLARKSDFVTFSGGETCLDPHLERHIAAARAAGFRGIEVQTNGLLMQDRAYVRRLVRAGMTCALVSLHSHIEEISDGITRSRGGFPGTLGGIGTLLDENVSVSLCHVFCSLNTRFFPSYVRFVGATFPGASLGIVTTLAIPTFRVRDAPDLMPRLSELAPYLKEGLSLCLPPGSGDREPGARSIGRLVDALGGSRRSLRSLIGLGRSLVTKPRLKARVISHCGIPLCMLRGFEPYHDEHAPTGSFPADIDLFHPPACGGCRWRDRCSGIWRLYADTYGDGEIRPVP